MDLAVGQGDRAVHGARVEHRGELGDDEADLVREPTGEGAVQVDAGSDAASECGAYHGMFAMPAHGFLRNWVPLFATTGVYRGGFVGDNASNPACHSRRDG